MESLIQFFSTLFVFCGVIIISQLVRLSTVLVAFGLTLENIFLPYLYVIVPFLPIIIPLSMVFAMMILFSRLSLEGEYVALLACGYPLRKVMGPIMAVCIIAFFATLFCGMNLEAWGRREFIQFLYRKTQTEVDNVVRYKIQPGVFVPDFLGYVLYAEEISEDRSTLTNVMLAPNNKSESNFTVFAPHAKISGGVEQGDLRMSLFQGSSFSNQGSATSVMEFEQADVDLLRVFQSRILGDDTAKDDYRSYTASQLIDYVRKNPTANDYRKAKYLLLSRGMNPFLIFAFCIFGILLGVQDARHGKSSGYMGAIITIILSYVLLVFCRWMAENGYINLEFAVFGPPVVLNALAIFLFVLRNKLPPSESIWNLRRWPFFGSAFLLAATVLRR